MQRQKQAAHDDATSAWLTKRPGGGYPKSRTAGLGELVRNEKNPPNRLRHPELLRARHKARQVKAYTASLLPPFKMKDDSRYFPHQGPRECARRIRQQG